MRRPRRRRRKGGRKGGGGEGRGRRGRGRGGVATECNVLPTNFFTCLAPPSVRMKVLAEFSYVIEY